LAVRLARENTDWGYGKIVGELGKVGYTVSEQTIANVLERHGIRLAVGPIGLSPVFGATWQGR
jgi:hypothetical protein